MKVFSKILIANRGEIAVRIIRTLKKMGISSVAVYSINDRNSMHVRLADESYLLNGDTLRETYLNIEKIIEIARESGAEAIHPGYGFLSENPEFSEEVTRAGINFIGPPAEVIRQMGNKLEARIMAKNAGIPLIEGYEGKADKLLQNISGLDFPVIVKAAAGGGGKAMRIVRNAKDFAEAVEITGREAYNYFGDESLYVEKYFERGRHIEIQVLADHYGNVIIPGERECSIQRRYQKVIEETPSVFLTPEKRMEMFDLSERIVREIGYVNAGTLEFLVDENQSFYFLEMNTRIQVEHPVTEATTGIDIVEQQILIAAGNKLVFRQHDVSIKGHAIQARIYAEDASKNFLPSPGTIFYYREPAFPGLRIDAGIDSPVEISPDFDPMIAKVIAWAHTREEAILLLEKSLESYYISGLTTNREFILSILNHQDFRKNKISITWLETARENLIEAGEQRKSKTDPLRIFSAWLLKTVFDRKEHKKDVWHEVGYWRHQIRKSFIFENHQYNIQILERNKDGILFQLNEDVHHAELRSLQNNKILYLLDDSWNCAVVVSGMDSEDSIFVDGSEFKITPLDYLPLTPYLKEETLENTSGPKSVRSPLHGKIVKFNASLNEKVSRGQVLFTLDAMKIENRIMSPWEGCIKEIRVRDGDQVRIDQEILIIDVCNEK